MRFIIKIYLTRDFIFSFQELNRLSHFNFEG